MTTLIIGLVVGSFSTLIGVWCNHKLQDQRTARMVARVLIPDLMRIRESMFGLGDPIRWDSLEFPPNSWAKHREELARVVRAPEDWATVSSVFANVRDLAEEASRHPFPEEMDELAVEWLEDTYKSAANALEVLRRYARDPKVPRNVRRARRASRRSSLPA